MKRWIWIALLLGGCDDETKGRERTETTLTGTPEVTTGVPTGTVPTGTVPTGTTPTGTTPSTTPPPAVRFVALGDAGTGGNDQYAVADAIETVCAQRGCDHAIYLGDNFYDTGVGGPDDQLFIDYFELPYANLNMPFYIALGNHDYGAAGLGIEFWKGGYYLDYAANYNTNFTFPDLFYSFEAENVKFMALNTTEIFFGLSDNQGQWIDDEIANLDPGIEWVIMFGHHPYISNGQHGNAGTYEGIPLIPIVSGTGVRDFFDDHICGRATVYFSGHDHNRQLLEPTCGTEFIVSGAGAKTTDLVGRGNPSFFEDDTIEGFVWVEIQGNQFTAAFYDKNALLEYEQIFTL